jgi:hypothetical protein
MTQRPHPERAHDGGRMTDDHAEIAWMVDILSRHAGRLLASEHADQLCADLLGWTDTDVPDGEQPRRHEGLAQEGRRLAFRSRGTSVRIRCTCGHRIPVEVDSEGRVDQDAVMRCGGCGEYGVLEWWRRREAATADPLPLSALPEWLLTVHALTVNARRLRDWADEGVITPITTDGVPQGGARPRRLFDPVAVATVAALRLTRRTA